MTSPPVPLLFLGLLFFFVIVFARRASLLIRRGLRLRDQFEPIPQHLSQLLSGRQRDALPVHEAREHRLGDRVVLVSVGLPMNGVIGTTALSESSAERVCDRRSRERG